MQRKTQICFVCLFVCNKRMCKKCGDSWVQLLLFRAEWLFLVCKCVVLWYFIKICSFHVCCSHSLVLHPFSSVSLCVLVLFTVQFLISRHAFFREYKLLTLLHSIDPTNYLFTNWFFTFFVIFLRRRVSVRKSFPNFSCQCFVCPTERSPSLKYITLNLFTRLIPAMIPASFKPCRRAKRCSRQ